MIVYQIGDDGKEKQRTLLQQMGTKEEQPSTKQSVSRIIRIALLQSGSVAYTCNMFWKLFPSGNAARDKVAIQGEGVTTDTFLRCTNESLVIRCGDGGPVIRWDV